MKDSGFDYDPFVYVNSDDLYRLLNPLNEDVASRFGYREPAVAEFEDPNMDKSQSFFDALTGCGNVAFGYAYGGSAGAAFAHNFEPLVPHAEQSIEGFFATIPGVDLLDEWSVCMKDLGYTFVSPAAAASSFTALPEVSDSEVEVRLADLECDTK